MKLPHPKGRVALITGASSGVGWQMAVRLAQAGMHLCITARRDEPLQQLRRELEADGHQCLAIPGDVTSDQDVERVVQACVDRFGRLDVLVNNAGVQVYGRFEEYSWEEIERVHDVNYLGYLRYARACLKHFRAQGEGHIINVLSVLSRGAIQYFSVYAASKHALLGWAECLRLELSGSGIDVSSILLPAVATPLYDHCRSHTGHAMRPLPPIYETDVAARAVLKCVRRPQPRFIPVYLQGRLILWTHDFVPAVGELLLRAIGERAQTRRAPANPAADNLFSPTDIGTGPHGSLQPTPAWKRLLGSVALLGLTGAGVTVGWRGLRLLWRFIPAAR